MRGKSAGTSAVDTHLEAPYAGFMNLQVPPELEAKRTRWRSTCWPARSTMTSGSAARLRRVAPPHGKAGCSSTTTSWLAWTGAIAADARLLDDGRRGRP